LYPAQVLLSEIMMRVGKVLQIIYSTSLNPKKVSRKQEERLLLHDFVETAAGFCDVQNKQKSFA